MRNNAIHRMMSTSLCGLWLLLLHVIHTSSIIITNVGSSRRNSAIGETTVVEWRVRSGNGSGDVTRGNLIFRHNDVILADLDLQTRTKSNVLSDPRLQWHSSGIGLYGYNISNIRIDNAGTFSCSYKEYMAYPESAHSNITLFVYAPPTKPIVMPQTPIMENNDVIFQCITQSQSEPLALRPPLGITWYKHSGQWTPGVNSSRYRVAGERMTIRRIDDREKNVMYRCEAREQKSPVSSVSDNFRIVLVTITESDNSQLEGIGEGDNVDFKWTVLGTEGIPPEYNHSLVFTRNGNLLAIYDLRYRHWKAEWSIRDRSIYISPGTGSYGFRIYDTVPEDMGDYACAYRDEFGTLVTSEPVRLHLDDHTYPEVPYTTMSYVATKRISTGVVTPDQEDITSGENYALPGASTQPQSLTMVIGSAMGVVLGCLLLVVLIIIPIVLCRRRKKPPENLMRANNRASRASASLETGGCQATNARYHDDAESRYSIYNTLRESLMVTEDMMRAGPSLPERDDTYNQPFEQSRRQTFERAPGAAYLKSHSLDRGACGGGDVCRPLMGGGVTSSGAGKGQLCRSLSERPEVEENAYLTPVSMRPGARVKYCNAAGSDPDLEPEQSPIYEQDKETDNIRNEVMEREKKNVGGDGACASQCAEESGYLTMGADQDKNMCAAMCNGPSGDPYVVMTKEEAEAKEKCDTNDLEYINLAPPQNPNPGVTVV